MIPTRRPVKSTGSCGQLPVWYQLPSKLSSPSTAGTLGVEMQPLAMTQYLAEKC